jgi:hypothetical protein
MNDIMKISGNTIVMRSGTKAPISRGYSEVKNKLVKWIFDKENS